MNIWIIAMCELRRMLRARAVLLNLFVLPLILIFILGSALASFFHNDKGDITPDPVRVAIVGNEVDGPISTAFNTFISSPELSTIIIQKQVSSKAAAEKLLRAGEADYAVIIPTDFNDEIIKGQEAKLELMLGNDRVNNLVAGTIFDSFLDAINHQQALAGTLGEYVPKQEQATEASSTTSSPTYVNIGKLTNNSTSYSASQYYAGAMMIMFLLYAGGTASESLFNEKDNRTLYRLQSLPISASHIFLGKMLGSSMVAIVQAGVIITVSSLVYGVDWGSNPLLLTIVCILLVFISMAIACLVALSVKTSASANSIMQVLIIGMTFLSGGFTPIPGEFIQKLGQFTVNHWGIQGILRIMLHSDPSEIVPSILALTSICAALVAATFVVYRKVGYHE
ncbi:ABC-2 type transport system permease protein [Paenibacillus sp. DS2015]|uniref:ABC transporter permease n=1 Tax=Paenibacillus sp. DS2015 TaxID=3373917 RepID=UPI003D21739E